MTKNVDILTIRLETQGDGTVKASLAGVSREADKASTALDRLQKELTEVRDRADPAAKSLRELAQDKATLTRAVQQGLLSQQQANVYLGQLDRQARATSQGFGMMKQAVGAIGLSSVITQSVQTIAEFQRLGAVLRTVEGSQDGANRKLRELQDLATKLPAQLSEIVTAYTTLKARGLDASSSAISAYTNVAAANGKSLQQFIEAVADASTGEMERLKEFGIVARQQGDQVALTFKGVTTVVAKEAGAITGYLRQIGEVEFAGAAAAQMETLGGKASNLQDSLDRLIVSVGDAGLTSALGRLVGALATVVGGMADFVDYVNRGEEGLGRVLNIVSRVNQFAAGLTTGGLFDPMEAFKPGQQAPREVGTVESLKKQYTDLANVVGRIYAAGQAKANEQKEKANDAAAKLIAKLKEQGATYGLTKSQVLEYEKTQALAAATTDKQRQEIAGLYDVLIEKTRAEEASTAATKRQTAADAEAKREKDARLQIEKQQLATAKQIVEYYDLAKRHAREYAEAEDALTTAVAKGALTAAQKVKVLNELRFDQLIESVRELGDEFKSLPGKLTVDEIEWRELGQRGASMFLDAWTDIMLGGDVGDIGRRFAETMLGEGFRTTLEQQFGRTFQQAIGSGSSLGGLFTQLFSGRGFESAPDFVGPPTMMAGGAVGGASWLGAFQNNMGRGTGFRNGQGGTNWGNVSQFAGGVYGVYQATQTQSRTGGALTGAASGAQAGMVFGPWGAVIGAVIGGLAGYFGAAGNKPRLRVGTSGSADGTAVSAFGRIGVNRDGDMPDGSATAAAQGIATFDNNMARFLRGLRDGTQLFNTARTALAGFSTTVEGSQANLRSILERRLTTIVQAIQPGWARLLGNIADLESRIDAFTALYELVDQVEQLDSTITGLTSGPVQQLRNQLDDLDSNVTRTAEALAAAIAAQDPIAIRDAATAAQQAVLERYQMEIQLATELEAALLNAQAAARGTQLGLAQRIQATGGPAGLVAGLAQANYTALRQQVGATASPERALAFLSEFVGQVDAWLAASVGDVQAAAAAEAQLAQDRLAAINEQRNAINKLLADLQKEADEIERVATERTRRENEAARAAAEAQQQAEEQARQSRLESLQAELDIARQFADVLERAQSFIKDLTFSSSNPLGGFARLDLLSNAIAQAEGRVAASSGASQAQAAEELLALLQQRIGLVQQEGLYQRPSGDYLQIYNDTLRRAAEVSGLAKPEADRVAELQEEIKTLSERVADSVSRIADDGVRYTADERARLDAIEQERALHETELRVLAQSEVALQQLLVDIQRDAEAQIRELQATAREHYEWARGEAERLEAQRQQEIVDQLNELTGGRPVDEFIADRTAEAASLLTEIRDSLREFLEAIGTNSGAVGGTGGGTSPIGGGGRPPEDSTAPKDGVFVLSPTINVTASGGASTDQVTRAVREVLRAELPAVASTIKRSLRTA